MTYLAFHLVLIVPPLLGAAYLYRRSPQITARGMRPTVALGVVAGIALVYTTPWDNYLVWRGVWSYGADRVIGTVGYVPIEEYLFFILQPLLTGCWLLAMLARRPPSAAESIARWVQALGAGAFFTIAAVGFWMLSSEATLYMGLILAWAAPVLALQWAYAGARFWQLRLPLLLGVAVPTVYLWLADRIAIGLGVWTISDTYTTGLHILGLPIEEAVFFLVTNLLVVLGITMFVAPPAHPILGIKGGGEPGERRDNVRRS